ncbi:unnamed protein product [Fusarium venenatum]|uniref:Uncharacterized protein n=1 Tax=Fusarium venenatum TaxID=56646 RepID=A0A2L2T3P3_9HYPO|nr:uncharacterized protein FVRRES_06689 [Fusarium venenatum]CEI62253.1 unnamed protein product [Fusarium venenatum]
MTRTSLLNFVAITGPLLEAKAGPCRPTTTTMTSLAETSSAAAPDSATTRFGIATVTALADATTMTKTGLDDKTDNISPWTIGNLDITQREPHAGVNAVYAIQVAFRKT